MYGEGNVYILFESTISSIESRKT